MDSIVPQRSESVPAPVEVAALPAVIKNDSYESLFPEPVVAVSAPPTWVWWSLLGIATVGLGVLGYNVANGKVSAWLSPASTPNSQAITLTATPAPIPMVTTAPPVAAVQPVAAPSASPSSAATPATATTVRILNGTPAEGAATRAKTVVSAAGFVVSTIGNTKSTYPNTIIYYQPGHIVSAQAIAKALTKYASTLQESADLASPDTVLVVLGPSN